MDPVNQPLSEGEIDDLRNQIQEKEKQLKD